MSEQENKPVINAEIKARLKDQSIWLHLLKLIMYGIAFMLSSWILLGATILHFILRLFTGEANAELQRFGQSMATYLYEIVQFISFNSTKAPFPLSGWPSGVPKSGASKSGATKTQASKKSATPKTAKKSTTSKAPKPKPKSKPSAPPKDTE